MTARQSQRSIIVVHPDFDRTWPRAADHLFRQPLSRRRYLRPNGATDGRDARPGEARASSRPARGSLIVLVTRAAVCDMTPLRERVLADELALAADVWDVEPLPLDDPLLGRQTVVHTPHIAGRTRDANLAWAENLAAQFDPSGL